MPETALPSREHVAELTAREDHGTPNPFTAYGRVKPGLVRAVTIRVALRGLDYASRHVFARDNLAGVRTIHFARWVLIDDGRRVVFASNYDGSQESYMDDFIDRVAWGVNLVFSNGARLPAHPLAPVRRRSRRAELQALPAQPPAAQRLVQRVPRAARRATSTTTPRCATA